MGLVAISVTPCAGLATSMSVSSTVCIKVLAGVIPSACADCKSRVNSVTASAKVPQREPAFPSMPSDRTRHQSLAAVAKLAHRRVWMAVAGSVARHARTDLQKLPRSSIGPQ